MRLYGWHSTGIRLWLEFVGRFPEPSANGQDPLKVRKRGYSLAGMPQMRRSESMGRATPHRAILTAEVLPRRSLLYGLHTRADGPTRNVPRRRLSGILTRYAKAPKTRAKSMLCVLKYCEPQPICALSLSHRPFLVIAPFWSSPPLFPAPRRTPRPCRAPPAERHLYTHHTLCPKPRSTPCGMPFPWFAQARVPRAHLSEVAPR